MSTLFTRNRYTGVAIGLHWLMALLLLGLFSLGVYMADLKFSPLQLKLFNWHKWAGITLLMLAVLRLAWRATHRPPAEPPMPAWQRIVAQLTHTALYLLFFATPLFGWAYSSAAGFQVVWFGVLPLPDLVPKDKALADTLKAVHGNLAWAMAWLVVLHVGAALKHQWLDRDGLLRRMWPGAAARLM